MAQYEHVVHEFEPVFDEGSRVLVLGSVPSVLSRANNFYYGNPQNRFWKVVATIFDVAVPSGIDEKKRMLLDCGIALWDVVGSCDIAGSSDASIKNVIPNDVPALLRSCPIENVYANGRAAEKLYVRYLEEACGRGIEVLPSTSPANAAYSLERLVACWQVIKQR